MKQIGIISFTEKGYTLSKKIKEALEQEGVYRIDSLFQSDFGGISQKHRPSSKEWVQAQWKQSELILFIGAVGIGVRLIVPFLEDKIKDPAVVVIDEGGKFCIPILSGHIGGANQWANYLADLLFAEPVITTATDGRGYLAIDSFGKERGMILKNKNLAKKVSASLLAGLPIAAIGIGCKKGTPKEVIMEAITGGCKKAGVPMSSLFAVGSINLKKEEAGILDLCKEKKLAFFTFLPHELREIKGDYTSSLFVQSKTGVDNVCERSAVKACKEGVLILKKTVICHVTVAIALDLARVG